MFASVKQVTDKFDWSMNQPVEVSLSIEVDADVAPKLARIKVRDISKVAYDKKAHSKKPSLVISSNGYSTSRGGDRASSLGNYLYGIPAGTRRKNAKHDYDFTRSAYGV